jgi:hypothetical protein
MSEGLLIGVCGEAGCGKDTVADMLVKSHGYIKIALADKIKRICKDVFDFSDAQLWGPSKMRNEPDRRYLRVRPLDGWLCHSCAVRELGDNFEEKSIGALGIHACILCKQESPRMQSHRVALPGAYLTPRHALQQLGTEWGRHCYENVWVDYTLGIAKKILAAGPKDGPVYWPTTGLSFFPRTFEQPLPSGVVISDVRFHNEVKAVTDAGGKLIRLKRKTSLTPQQSNHQSELEMQEMPDSIFHAVIDNQDMSLEQLEIAVSCTIETLLNSHRGTLRP